MNDKAGNQNDTEKLSIPLEYCRLDRAARLLGCEISDLIHWGAIGAINLCYYLHNENVFMGFLNYLTKETKTAIEGQLQIGYSITPYAHIFSEDSNRLNFIVWGMFPLTSRNIQTLEQGQPLTKINAEFFVKNDDGVESRFSLSMSQPKENDDLDKLITTDDIWVTKPDLVKLQNAITTGILANIYNSEEMAELNRRQTQEPSKQTRVPDSSIRESLGYMAMLLSESHKKYKYGDRPNAKQIRENVKNLAIKVIGDDAAKELKISNLDRDIIQALGLIDSKIQDK